MTNSKFQIQTEQFVGPIEKLLELIEAKELDITTISLSAVTADFLHYVEKLAKEATEVPPQLLADFIAVAAKLLLIKSKTLLPQAELTPEEEAEIKNLEQRLKLYQEIKAASKHIAALWNEQRVLWGREFLSGYQPSVFYPSPKLTVTILKKKLSELIAILHEAQLREKKFIQKALVSVEQKMKDLMNHLRSVTRSTFFQLMPLEKRDEIIALFLAVLHLVKDRLIEIEQSEHFADIVIKPRSSDS